MKLVWEELMVSLLVKEFTAMYVTRCFITMWTKTVADPFAITLRQSAKPKNVSMPGTLSFPNLRSYGEFWAPRPNPKVYNVIGCLRPWILVAGPLIFADLFLHVYIYIIAPQERAVCRPTPYLPRARTIPLVACVSVFPHMHAAVSFAGNVCGSSSNRMTLLWKNAWGWLIQARGSWAMYTVHSVGRL